MPMEIKRTAPLVPVLVRSRVERSMLQGAVGETLPTADNSTALGACESGRCA
jgi:hypothetical protein